MHIHALQPNLFTPSATAAEKSAAAQRANSVRSSLNDISLRIQAESGSTTEQDDPQPNRFGYPTGDSRRPIPTQDAPPFSLYV